MARLSGLQRGFEAISCRIRSVKTKPEQNREHWRLYIREEFGKHRHLFPKKLFSVIEHLIRVGHRRYEMYLNPNIKDIH